MDNDDQPIGNILSRREALTLFGLSGAALLAACAPAASPSPTATATAGAAATAASDTAAASSTAALPSCIARPALTEGPYFVDERLERSDVRSDPSDGSVRPGVPLALTFLVSNVANNMCSPMPNVMVDIWHCDAQGVYSDASDPTFGSTAGQKFLRGYQVTDQNGLARFTTIYPGWYQGRAVHIHFKIRNYPPANAGFDFTSQVFFDEAVSDQVFQLTDYQKRGEYLRNSQDGIYNQSGGQTLLALTPQGEGGYSATFDIGLSF